MKTLLQGLIFSSLVVLGTSFALFEKGTDTTTATISLKLNKDPGLTTENQTLLKSNQILGRLQAGAYGLTGSATQPVTGVTRGSDPDTLVFKFLNLEKATNLTFFLNIPQIGECQTAIAVPGSLANNAQGLDIHLVATVSANKCDIAAPSENAVTNSTINP